MSTYQYVEAVRRFGHHLTQEFLISEAQYARTNVSPDHLASYFLVLSSDLVQTSQPPTPQSQGPARPRAAKRGAETTPTTSSKKAKNKRGKGKGKGGKGTVESQNTQDGVPGTSNPFSALSSPDDTPAVDRSFVGDDLTGNSG